MSDDRTNPPEDYHVYSDLLDERDPGSWGAAMWSVEQYTVDEHETRQHAVDECWRHADRQRAIGAAAELRRMAARLLDEASTEAFLAASSMLEERADELEAMKERR